MKRIGFVRQNKEGGTMTDEEYEALEKEIEEAYAEYNRLQEKFQLEAGQRYKWCR